MIERSSSTRLDAIVDPGDLLPALPPHDVGVAVVGPCDEPDEAVDEIATTVARNVRRLRTSRGHSLERLARLSGVSRAMLGQIETSKSVPTIAVLDKIARALGVPIGRIVADVRRPRAVVLRREEARVVTAHEGRFVARALVPIGREGRVEFWELKFAPRHQEAEGPRSIGTIETLVVVAGALEVEIGDEAIRSLKPGDAITFDADVGHVYRNPSAMQAVVHVVVTPPDFRRG
jgi:transcriptional regulator with XRE-family HTH domain